MAALFRKFFILTSTFFILLTTFTIVSTQLNPNKKDITPSVLGSVVNELIASPSGELEKDLDPKLLFNLVNEYREENDLEKFMEYPPLCEYAQLRSVEIKDDWSHDKFYKDVEAKKISEFCPDCQKAGENLAHFYPTEKEIFKAWINSPEHKKNLEADWNWACVAIAENTYAALVFGKEK